MLAHRQRVEAAVLGRVAAQSGMSTASLLQRLGGEGLMGPASEKRRRLVLLTLLRDVAAALSYLASLPQPVVHRDVKPANVLISAQGELGRMKAWKRGWCSSTPAGRGECGWCSSATMFLSASRVKRGAGVV